MARGPWHEEVDLVVVGASVGGLAAAVMAADRGCRTIVVERSKELGGGAATEAEMIAAAGSRWQRAAARAIANAASMARIARCSGAGSRGGGRAGSSA